MEISNIFNNFKHYHKRIGIIPSISPIKNEKIDIIYQVLSSISKDVMIIQPSRIVCTMQLINYDYYLIFGDVCIHSRYVQNANFDVINENSNLALESLKENWAKGAIKAEDIFSFTNNNDPSKIKVINDFGTISNIEDKIEINEENLHLFPNIKKSDYTSFLMSRLGQIERAKSKKIYNIIFTDPKYYNTVQKLEKFIKIRNKNFKETINQNSQNEVIESDILIYKNYLMDISYERLTAVDNIEVIILICCPSFIPFDNELLIPLLTPFDVLIMLDVWKDGRYFPNSVDFECEDVIKKFDFENENKTDKKHEISIFRNDIISLNEFYRKNGLVSVPYFKDKNENEDECDDDEIKDGRSGIASSYENEK